MTAVMKQLKKYSSYRMALMLLIVLPFTGYAQVSNDSAIHFFKKFCSTYSNVDHLGFKIKYSYANELAPSVVLDSLHGEIKMNKQNCHVVLGNMETISNNNYSVILFKEDSIMYLSKPQPISALYNPASMADSFFTKTRGLNISIEKNESSIILTMHFPEGMDYKTAEFTIDSVTGYLQKVKYQIKATDLLDPSAKAIADNSPMKDEWAIVESEFYDYTTGEFGDTEFDDTRYFTKEGTEYKTTDAYKQYKIFKASPNL
jgi:hypothetical protein